MARLWVRIIRKHRISSQDTEPCTMETAEYALTEVCKRMDLPNPMWLEKHEREFQEFRHTGFLPEHFIEEVSFDRMEIEYLDDSGKKRHSNDPRNQF